MLRNELRLNGPRFGCGLAQCGSCSVLLNGEEFVLVLDGCLLLELEGSAAVVLERGDSAYYPSDRPHRWSNAGDEITRLVSVASPPHW